MDSELKVKWIEALRSGKYEQGSLQLGTPGDEWKPQPSFCCLGVLCEVQNIPKMEAHGYFYYTIGDREEVRKLDHYRLVHLDLLAIRLTDWLP